jgi:hypothetical protein
MDANDLPSAAVHLAERRDKRGMLLSCWLVARCEDALGRAGRTQPGNLYISSTAMCQQRKHSRPPKVGSVSAFRI